MLKKLAVSNFTLFPKTTFEFSPQLNVVVGDNGAGKSHFLKLGYILAASSYSAGNSSPPATKDDLQRLVAEKLVRTMRPETLGRLISRKPGRTRSVTTQALIADRRG
jgi:recombinational DNA repair ATPase RecF